MSGMSSLTRTLTLCFAALAALAAPAAAQNGTIEFVARVAPTGGVQEPVRGFPFFLLSKSFVQISKEVDAADPKPDMNAYIDKLDVSPELKAWMKKYHWIQLAGEDFIHQLKPDDILGVPEFRKAYMERNASDKDAAFPKAKVKPSDAQKNPEKFERLSKEYTDAVKKYIQQNPDSVDGIDLGLTDIDPYPKWQSLLGRRGPEIHRRALDLAQSKYLVAQTQTNLQGQGFINNVPPGTYWISTLDATADVGDVRPRWDVPVSVAPGQTEYVALSNVNSVPPPNSASQ